MIAPERNIHLTIIGTGAMACLFGARLAPVSEVTLTGSWIEGIAAIRNFGIAVENPSESSAARVAAVPWGDAVEPADLALILVKAWQTREVARHLPRLLRPGGSRSRSKTALGTWRLLERLLASG